MITDEQIRNAIDLRNRVAVAVAATNMFGRDEPASYTVDAITASLLQVEAMEYIRAEIQGPSHPESEPNEDIEAPPLVLRDAMP